MKPILCLIAGNEGYGVRRAWLGIIAALEEAGEQISVVSVGPGALVETIEGKGISVSLLSDRASEPIKGGRAKISGVIARAMKLAAYVRALNRCVAACNPRLILVRQPSDILLAAVVARMNRIRAFWLMPNSVSDGYPLDINRRFYALVFRSLGAVPIANSRYTDSTLGHGNFPRYVAHLGVDPEEFDGSSGNAARSELGLREGDIAIGVFARLVPEKGQKQLIDAVAALGPAAERLHVLIFGGPLDTIYGMQLQKSAEALQPRIHFAGPISDVAKWYAACDVVANTRLDPEPFGLSVIEAMAAGKPVLAHKAGGPGETVIDGVTGWFIHEPTVAGFADGLTRMLHDQPKWKEMGARARARARGEYTHHAMTARLLAIFADVGC